MMHFVRFLVSIIFLVAGFWSIYIVKVPVKSSQNFPAKIYSGSVIDTIQGRYQWGVVGCWGWLDTKIGDNRMCGDPTECGAGLYTKQEADSLLEVFMKSKTVFVENGRSYLVPCIISDDEFKFSIYSGIALIALGVFLFAYSLRSLVAGG